MLKQEFVDTEDRTVVRCTEVGSSWAKEGQIQETRAEKEGKLGSVLHGQEMVPK